MPAGYRSVSLMRRGLARLLNRGFIGESGRPDGAPPLEAGFPDWSALIASDPGLWRRSLERAAHGPSVLVGTNTGLHGPVVTLESMLAAALTLRGAKVRLILCDGALPACVMALSTAVAPEEMAAFGPARTLCRACIDRGRSVYDRLGLPVDSIGTLVSNQDRAWARRQAADLPLEEIPGFALDGMRLGEHATAGALRYFARGSLADEPFGEEIQRRYFESALLMSRAMQRLLARYDFAAAAFHHGIYTPQGILTEACRAKGVRLATWAVAYRRNCFIMSHDDTYHHTLMDEPTDHWAGMTWSPAHESAILHYLESRAVGAHDWIYFHEAHETDMGEFAERIGLDPAKPVIGLLTNVVWDAQLHYPANAFPNMVDWVLTTIRYFAGRSDLQLLIRVHPAEVRGTVPSRQRIVDEIAKVFPRLPANVFVVGPEDPLSTYAAMARCNAALIFGTKMGVELTSVGMPVIVAGEAWIRNKGLTLDARSVEDYIALLDRLPLPPLTDPAMLERARKYAYHFFFRRMIPLPFMEPNGTGAMYSVNVTSLDDLLPGRWRGLDIICDGILKGSPFVYPADQEELPA